MAGGNRALFIPGWLLWSNGRFFSSAPEIVVKTRPQVSKPLDVDMLRMPTFATPFEAVYSNICAMKHRLSLWTNLRIRRQLEIDSSELYAIGNKEMKWMRGAGAPLCFQRHVAVVQGIPNAALGINRTVTLSFNPDNLFPENQNAAHAVKLFCSHRYDPFTNLVTIKADRFPFQEQNRKFLKDIVHRLREAALVRLLCSFVGTCRGIQRHTIEGKHPKKGGGISLPRCPCKRAEKNSYEQINVNGATWKDKRPSLNSDLLRAPCFLYETPEERQNPTHILRIWPLAILFLEYHTMHVCNRKRRDL